MPGGLDYDAQRADWSAFFSLLSNDHGIKLRLNLPDTLVLQRGQPLAWFATNTEGYVVQRSAALCSLEDVRQHLLNCALDSNGSYPQYVAIMRLQDGAPKLLTCAALDALCARLAAELEAGEERAPGQTPCVLQACPTPFLDLRFVTSLTNTGCSITCHTFQRRFSRRYLPYREPAAPLLPDALSATHAMQQHPITEVVPRPGVVSHGAVSTAGAAEGGQAAGDGASTGASPGADLGAAEEGGLDDAALADSERHRSKTLGPVDPSLKMLMRKAAHFVVQYVQKAHLLTLRGLVCEFVRDSSGHLWFLGPLRTEWASLIPGRGGEPWANTNLTQQPQAEESWPSTMYEEVEQQAQHAQQPQQPQQDSAAVAAGEALAGSAFGLAQHKTRSFAPVEGHGGRGSDPPCCETVAHPPPHPALLQAGGQHPSSPCAASRLAAGVPKQPGTFQGASAHQLLTIPGWSKCQARQQLTR